MRLIECRRCDARNCEGCNMLTLAEMLHKGDLDCLMDEHHSIVLTPESIRPKGRWRLNKDGSGTCSECHRTRNDVWDMDNWDNFCSHCGAKMEW
jgi:hypothetical protein